MDTDEKQKTAEEEGAADHNAAKEDEGMARQKAGQGTGAKKGGGSGEESLRTDEKRNERQTGKTESSGSEQQEGKADKKGGETGKGENAENGRGTDKTADGQAKIAELQGLLIKKTEELTKIGERAARLERAATEANERSAKLDGSLKEAVASYRTLISAANPDVLPEMLSGESIEELDSSLAKARELIGKIKTGLEAQSQTTRVPAGAPQRGAADLSGLSSREKIRIGLERAGR